jgi:hypothetical protein
MPRHIPEILLRLSDPELWENAKWSATTFRWHPTGEQPPIIGIVFDNAEAGRNIFKEWQQLIGGCEDKFEEIRVCIIDGTDPSGYFVHLSPDPDNVTARATTEDFVMPSNLVWLTRINWMLRVPGTEDLLTPFKREFEKHREFLLAPVTRRSDGQLRLDLMLGVVKRRITFRHLSEIREGDFDALVLQAKHLNSPAESHPPMP